MSEEASTIMRLCTENVYNDNIFHLLGIPTTATQRQIRRRREDVESAHGMGSAAWNREFGHLLGTRSVPTFAEVNEAFEHLSDPEYRIVSEFFWLWTMDDDDAALRDLLDGNQPAAIRTWEQRALGTGRNRLVAQHNLAVLYHFYAIGAERQVLDGNGFASADFRKAMCDYWEKAFGYWAELVGDDDFWEIYEDRMRAFDDPRLTGGFMWRFRRDFPIAVGSINARFAAEYARHKVFSDAKRHVDYMLKTAKGLDDVEEAMRILFEPMERIVSTLIKRYDGKVDADPHEGLACAEGLLNDVDAVLRVVQGALSEGQRVRMVILTETFNACNRYAVAYGNKTEKWEDCLSFLERLKPLACTGATEEALKTNIEVVKGNIKIDKEQNTCWLCGNRHADARYLVAMYGNIAVEMERIRWNQANIEVPVCLHCMNAKKRADSIRRFAVIALAVAVFAAICFLAVEFVFLGAVAALAAGWWGNRLLRAINGFDAKCGKFPRIVGLRENGWNYGEKPPIP